MKKRIIFLTFFFIMQCLYVSRYLQIIFFRNWTSCQPSQCTRYYFRRSESIYSFLSSSSLVESGIQYCMNRDSLEGARSKICLLLCWISCCYLIFCLFFAILDISWSPNKLAASSENVTKKIVLDILFHTLGGHV